MFGYLAFLVPAIFNRGDLTNDHELPEIPSMNAIIISKCRDHYDRWYTFVCPTWKRLKIDAIAFFISNKKFTRMQRLTLRTAIKRFIQCTTSKKDLFVVEDSFFTLIICK